MRDIRPYAFYVAKASKVGTVDIFKLWLLRLVLPSHFYIGVVDSNSQKKFIKKYTKSRGGDK